MTYANVHREIINGGRLKVLGIFFLEKFVPFGRPVYFYFYCFRFLDRCAGEDCATAVVVVVKPKKILLSYRRIRSGQTAFGGAEKTVSTDRMRRDEKTVSDTRVTSLD